MLFQDQKIKKTSETSGRDTSPHPPHSIRRLDSRAFGVPGASFKLATPTALGWSLITLSVVKWQSSSSECNDSVMRPSSLLNKQ